MHLVEVLETMTARSRFSSIVSGTSVVVQQLDDNLILRRDPFRSGSVGRSGFRA